MTTFYGQLSAGAIPDKPFLLIGQMTTADPTRSPAGTESLWAYTHVPQEVRSDACGELTGSWDASELERFADRMQARIEQHAPGFASRIIARRILGPAELEARNANLVGGSVNGGTAALDQQVIFRPIPGLGRANTRSAACTWPQPQRTRAVACRCLRYERCPSGTRRREVHTHGHEFR